MTYAETLEYLFALRSIGSKFGLERMRVLYEAAGKPAQAIPILHVAGTNGKGSVCAMAEAILRANGYRTGLFTSPHLERLGERVQVNREILSEQQIVDYVRELRPLCERIATDEQLGSPTFFELMTVIALLHFEREGCDVVILETGLGGRLDSTNVVTATVTAITSIGLDHQEILGETLEQIAAEKAGIIKQGVPLVLGKLPPAAKAVVLSRAAELNACVLDTQILFDCATLRPAALSEASFDTAAATSDIDPLVGTPCAGVSAVAASASDDASAPSDAASAAPPDDASAAPHDGASAAPPDDASAAPHDGASAVPFDGAFAAVADNPAGTSSGFAVTGAAAARQGVLRAYPQTSLAGEFQRRNAAVALLATEWIGKICPQLGCDRQTSLEALCSVQWAGRWQTQILADGCELILDCSHNEEGAQALEENLSQWVRERGVRPIVISGSLGEARARSLLAVVGRYAQAVFLVAVQQPRACTVEQLRAAVPATFEGEVFTGTVNQLFEPQLRAGELLRAYREQRGGECVAVPVLVTGSVYLIGEILSRLHGVATTETVLLQDKISD